MTIPITFSLRHVQVWRLLQITLALTALALGVGTIRAALAPVEANPQDTEMASQVAVMDRPTRTFTAEPNNRVDSNSPVFTRRGLLKTASPLRQRTTGDKTVEQVTSLLALRCIMPSGDGKVAYISIKNKGMRRCAVGDCVEEMFTVLGIRENSVDIEVADKNVTLGFK